MNEQYQRAKDLFLKVCDLKNPEREALLDKECANDPDLRAEVESLLAHRKTPTVSMAFGVTQRSSLPEAGPKRTHIGSYRVIHELGQGGMGVVYLCTRDDDHIKHRVAIKLVKRGMDTEQVLKRFELERQLLAAMNHPGIARLFDAGQTEDGLPYLVMEYVEGQPIDEYCDTRRLSIADRLKLFRKVCSAVHYAHQNLIVHRDLKPSNIMVSANGEPKLLDFGIAKLLNPELSLVKGDPTAPGFRVMTPEYASPEQVRGYPITTASDVYSLGVLLYELMCGHRPYHLKSRVQAEIERAICEEDPEKPSTSISRIESTQDNHDSATTKTITPESVSKDRESRPDRLKKRLAGDIDNIVLMAMRKEPQRRYSSAEQLSEDIARHLDGLPVISRGDSMGYRFNKFVHRHRAGVAAVIVIALSLLAGIIGTSWQAQIAETQRKLAETEREKAERRFDQVRSLAHTFMFDFHDAIVKLDGSIPARQLLVTTALEYLDNLAQDAGDNNELKRELASAYDRVGQINKSNRNPSLDNIPSAIKNYRKGLVLRQDLLTASPENQELNLEVSTSHIYIGDMLKQIGKTAEAVIEYREAMQIRESLMNLDPKWKRHYAIILSTLGAAALQQGNPIEAKQLYLKSLPLREELVAASPNDLMLQRDLSSLYLRVGGRLADEGDNQGALDRYKQTVALREQLLNKNPDSGRAKRDLAVAYFFVAQTYLALNNATAAIDPLQHYILATKQRAEDNPNSARAQSDLAIAHELLGSAYYQNGDWEQARESFMEFGSAMRSLNAASPDNTKYSQWLAVSHEHLGEVAVATDNPGEAIDEYRKALVIVEALAAKDPDDVRWPTQRARIQVELGTALNMVDETDEAQLQLLAAKETYSSLMQKQSQDAEIRNGLVKSLQQLAKLSAKHDEMKEALRYIQTALQLLDDGPALFDTTDLRQELESDQDLYRKK